ncbi:glycosyltransferase family protein [Microbacterium gorillae]|uniref:glycosyltransferase family protein n=1 Tax=Microbacterium gorillae TaxID=1231063 RepID=UPI000B9B2F16|nr:glycosyltransferase [Microbacterium gorillae]
MAALPPEAPGPSKRMTFFLASGLDPDTYAAQHERGLTPDRHPYGTENVPDGWRFAFAAAPVPRLLRRPARVVHRVLGFDLVRALANRRALRRADAIYCHTEVEYLAAATVIGRGGPVLIGQTIWLFRRFAELGGLRRWASVRALRRVDVLVSNALPNHELGRALAPAARHVYVPFGVSRRFGTVARAVDGAQVLGVGNDVARDWDTFGDALSELPGVTVRVAGRQPVLVRGTNVAALTAGVDELLALYAHAVAVVVALRPNAHASGITTVLEAVAAGAPVIASDTGGLRDYFTDDEVLYVAPESSEELQAAITSTLADPEAASSRARAARERMDADAYWNDAYWDRIVALVADDPLPSRRQPAGGEQP